MLCVYGGTLSCFILFVKWECGRVGGMKNGECYLYIGYQEITMFGNPPYVYLNIKSKTKHLLQNNIFIVLNIKNNITLFRYELCVLIDNERWYFEVPTQCIKFDFKKII